MLKLNEDPTGGFFINMKIDGMLSRRPQAGRRKDIVKI